jgi:Transposase IS66 family
MTDRDLQPRLVRPRLVREGLLHLCLVCAGILGNVGGSDRGPHQRCWAPLLRDLHRLKEDHATDAGVVGWAQAVRALDDDAPAALGGLPLPAALRTTLARQLEAQAFRLGVRYAGVTGHPCRALARRLLRHQGELFEFVRVTGLTADNNAAERLLPPIVVQCNARLAAGPAVRKVAPLAWPWPRCSTPGAPAASTPSMNASLCCTFLYLKCEHVQYNQILNAAGRCATVGHSERGALVAVDAENRGHRQGPARPRRRVVAELLPSC